MDETALAIHLEVGDREGEALTRLGIASTYLQLGEVDRGVLMLEALLGTAAELDDHRLNAAARHALGGEYEMRGDLDGALALYEDSLVALSFVGDVQAESAARNSESRVLHLQGRTTDSRVSARTALDALARLSNAASVSGDSRAAARHLLQRREEVAVLVDVALSGGAADEQLGLRVAELMRGRSLSGQLRAPFDLSSAEQWALELWQRADAAYDACVLSDPSTCDAARLLDARLDARSRLEESVGVRERLPEFDAATLQEALRPGERFVAYLRGSTPPAHAPALAAQWFHDEQHLYAVWIDADGGTGSVDLGAVDDIDAQAESLYRTALAPGAAGFVRWGGLQQRQAQALYERLVAPVRGDPNAVRHLIVSADPQLSYLPLDVLVIEESEGDTRPRFVLDELAVSYISSLAALDALRSRGAARAESDVRTSGLGAVVDPDYTHTAWTPVPDSRSHVEAALGGLTLSTPAWQLGGSDATVDALRDAGDELSSLRFLLIAAHGVDDLGSAGGQVNAMLLTGGRSFDLYDAVELELNAELVTLSGCQTALGNVSDEGRWGLVEGFLIAGAQRTQASLWSVPVQFTDGLHREFFARVRDAEPGDPSVSYAEALRQAKLSVLDGEGIEGEPMWRTPGVWAAWVLVGDG